MLIALTVLTGALLLFIVQPLMGAILLPWFGGSPEVWTISLLFFQVVLLIGYAWAHWLVGRRGRTQGLLHLALLAASLATLPIGAEAPSDATTAPVSAALTALGLGVGLPYLVLAANSTLLQAWAARMSDQNVWRLYAWSNLGSLLAVIAWPVVVEPWLAGPIRLTVWSWAYGAFSLLLTGVILRWLRVAAAPPHPLPDSPPPPLEDHLVWLGAPALGSAMLLAATASMTVNVSVVPILWVLPLVLYLLTWIIAFAVPTPTSPEPGLRAMLLGAICLAGAPSLPLLRSPLLTVVGIYAAGLFLFCLGLHLETARRRPPERHLTRFYLTLAMGGVLGGLCVGLIAPAIFDTRLEYGLALGAGALAAVWLQRRAWVGVGAATTLALVILSQISFEDGELLEERRGFFGTLTLHRTVDEHGDTLLHLVDGRISHGLQYEGARRREPLGYYVPASPPGQLLLLPGPPRSVGLVGLGAGTLAALGRAGDTFTFYEINPDVVDLAQTRFTYLADSLAHIRIVRGDGRLSLRDAPPQGFDLLVLDAFSGDAVPAHLLTREAFAQYRRHIKPDGAIMVHVSNAHLDLDRIVYGIALDAGMDRTWRRSVGHSPLGMYVADWMVLGTPEALAATHLIRGDVPSIEELGRGPLWVDGSTPLWPYLR